MMGIQVESTGIPNVDLSFDGQKMQTRLGEITIYEQNLVTFPEGLLGFESARHFVISDVPGAGIDTNFALMQSLETPDLCFIILNATLVQKLESQKQPYVVDMVAMAEELAQRDVNLDQFGLAFVVSINTNEVPAQITINSSAPIVISNEGNDAYQVVLTNPKFTVSQVIYG